ncbi:MAG: SGNH/GDSL hydrolase family protein, partial [Candidatus Woesearchaeota archaeon]|nr:SGNH/GDSL hydrolase family protein [Candidatus Woesearchaeota archaeon]
MVVYPMKKSEISKRLETVLIAVITLLFAAYLMISIRSSHGTEFITNLSNESAEGFNSSNRMLSDNPILIYEIMPNTRVQVYGYWVKFNRTTIETVNSDGFRGRDYSIEKPKGVYRIIVLGDSFTEGFGVNDNETFSYCLEQMLNSLNISGKRFEVLNLGVGGYNTLQEVEQLKVKGLKYNPDLVIIAHHASDVENISEIEKNTNEMYASYLKETAIINNNISHNILAYFRQKAFEIFYKKIFYDVHAHFRQKAFDIFYKEIANMPFEQVFENVRQPMEALYNLSLKEDFSLMITHFPEGIYMKREQAEKLSKFSYEKDICYLDFIEAYD